MQPTRKCGDCTACCTTHAIPAIKKPEMSPCQNLASNGGCGVYGLHPRACREYFCLWLEGFGREDERPDKTGFVLDWGTTRGGVTTLRIASVTGIPVPEAQAKELLVRFQLERGHDQVQGLLAYGADQKELIHLSC